MKQKRLLNIPLPGVALVAFALFTALSRCEAQDLFTYRSALGPVGKEGFYKITLTPALLSTCKEDRSDIRIADSQGKYIPYLFKADLPVFSSQNFLPFPIVFNAQSKDSSTELIIENESAGSLSSLLLEIKNYSAYRTAMLSGSDDRQKWFVIRETIVLEEANSNSRDHHVQSISFPSANYRFFKIHINDKGLLPINILKAGIYTHNLTNGRYLEIPDPLISQKDSTDKHSYITLRYKEPYFIDRLDLRIKGPVFYKRKAWIYAGSVSSGRRVAEIRISPADSSFILPSVKTDQLLVDIVNEDDPPLVLQKAVSAQINQYLLTYLQPGSACYLLTGDSSALSPDYDLKYAADSLIADPKEILAGPLEKAPPPKQAVVAVTKEQSTIWLWSILALVLLLLAFLSFKMMQSINERNEKTRNDRL